jgi:uncharacterized membrane protein
MSNRSICLALATAVTAAAALSVPASAQEAGEKEKCFGVSLAGKNDCASTGNNSCAGTSKADFDKGAWKYVAKGTCTSMEVTLKDGSKRKGSLDPIKG